MPPNWPLTTVSAKTHWQYCSSRSTRVVTVLGFQTVDKKEGKWVGESLLVVCTASEMPLPKKNERECLPLWSGSMKIKNDPLRSENSLVRRTGGQTGH